METPQINWNKDETLAAAEKAPRLSTLLEQEGFYESSALQYVTHDHVAKFLGALDAEEAKRLYQFAVRWHYTSESNSSGFPLLNKIWALGQEPYAGKSGTSSDGRQLIARLTAFEPDWIGRWWKWRFRSRAKSNDDMLTKVFIHALTKDNLRSHASELSNEDLTAIVVRRPALLDALAKEQWGAVLASALLEDRGKEPHIPEVLSWHGIPTDISAIIDAILDSKEENLLRLLDKLVANWNGPPGSDPVTRTIKEGHDRLDTILRSLWYSPEEVKEKGDSKLWTDRIGSGWWGKVGHAIASAANAVPSYFGLELGFAVGVRIANDGREPTPVEVKEGLKKLGLDPSNALVSNVVPMAELWATLCTLAKYEANSWQHKTELVGLRAKVASLAAASPLLWARALPWICVRASTLGNTAQAVTLELASTTEEVRSALESACNDKTEPVRLMARGMRALLHGLENPGSGLTRTLADAAAHYIDGTPIFPHPLAPLSATWLGATGVECTIANGVRRAADRFASEVRDQGGDIEEALTKALIKELEVEFRGIRPQLKLIGTNASRSPTPILSVCQRPASKRTEEPIYGCDIAWVLNATVHDRYSATWVDLIQVKKSLALQRKTERRFRADSWEIDCKQLNNILKWSATSAYWLIASAGEVLVIPARYLEGIRCGTETFAGSKSFTVGYHEVRSAAIPLEQYLVDLLIGQWVGTSSEEVTQFARGENSNIRPRLVVEVTITMGQENQ